MEELSIWVDTKTVDADRAKKTWLCACKRRWDLWVIGEVFLIFSLTSTRFNFTISSTRDKLWTLNKPKRAVLKIINNTRWQRCAIVVNKLSNFEWGYPSTTNLRWAVCKSCQLVQKLANWSKNYNNYDF